MRLSFATCKNRLHNFQFCHSLLNHRHCQMANIIICTEKLLLSSISYNMRNIMNIFWALFSFVTYLCNGLFSIDPINLCCDAENVQRKPWLSRTFDIRSVSMFKFRFSHSCVVRGVRVQLLYKQHENKKKKTASKGDRRLSYYVVM